MKNFIALLGLWCLSVSLSWAAIPKAEVSVAVVNNQQWPAQFTVGITVPPEHHAYLNAGDENAFIPIAIDARNQLAEFGLQLTDLQKPAGVYDATVKAQVLRGQGTFSFAVDKLANQVGQNAKPVIPLAVNYQLCNEVTNVCFRPQTAQLELALPLLVQSAAASQPAAVQQAPASFTDKLLQLFKDNQDSMLILFVLMFVAGLLSVATPCVYPMLPITSMFIINRANGVANKEKQHALVYLLGMVGTYMLLGLIAGMSGGAFNSFMQSAWVNLLFAGFFAFFALALLGFYELGLMQNEVHTLDQRTSRVHGLAGTWLMGHVAGLVISPCVGPIVFALLLQVADKIALKAEALAALQQSIGFWEKLGIASQGSLMMAGFGLGVGLPFFLVSVIKFKKLPKAGYWMNKIKYAFGFVILYFAYTYLEKGMGVLGVEHQTTLALAIGLVIVWIAVVHCNVLTALPAESQPNQKMFHYLGVMALIIGGWLVIASLGQLPLLHNAQASTLKPAALTACSSNTEVAATPVEQEAGIAWYRNFAAAKQVALQTHKPIFIDFYASWCANCVAFKAATASNAELNAALRNKAVALKLVDKEPEFEEFRETPEHRQLKIGLPYFAILSPEGTLIWSGTDYTAVAQMISVLDNFSANSV